MAKQNTNYIYLKMENNRTLSEKLIGLSFNPSQFEIVDIIKLKYVEIVELLLNEKDITEDIDKKEMIDYTIKKIIEAKMWTINSIHYK